MNKELEFLIEIVRSAEEISKEHFVVKAKGTAARVFTSLANAGVNIQMIDQGSSELNIIVGVDANDYITALRAIYGEFVKD